MGMERKFTFVRPFAALIALAACRGQPAVVLEPAEAVPAQPDPRSGTAAELYGLQVGARWTYLRTDDVLRWKEITGCEDVLILDPETGAASTVRAYVRENRGESGTTSVHYLVEDQAGVKRVRRDDVDFGALMMFATYEPAGVRLHNGPYPDGFTWEHALVTAEFVPWDNSSRGRSQTSAVDRVLGEETLEVMAGSYRALGIERQWDARNAHNVQSWYAPGVGEVRERTEWPEQPLPRVQIEELVAFEPGYGSCDGRPALFDTACDAPLASCANAWGAGVPGCTDVRVDFANCGACGDACESGVCAGGSCVEPFCDIACAGTTVCCPSAWGWLQDGCTSPSRDRWNCGACGNVCADGLICDHGECTCGPGTADCGTGSCEDVLEDRDNCGACGVACNGDTPICDKGVCVSSCLSVDLVHCGDECVDLAWDSNHCGDCDVECGDGTGSTSCAQGRCVPCADAGMTDCAGDCADLAWSDKHCGECGAACDVDEACVAGECVSGDGDCTQTCNTDNICCGGECVDPRTSDNHCGGCGVARCSGGCTEACRDGTCQAVDCGGGDD